MKSLLILELTTTAPLKVRVDSIVMPRASTSHTDANQGSGKETSLETSLKPRTVVTPLIKAEGKITMPEVHPNIRKYAANGIS